MKVGDKVETLDDNITGKIVKIHHDLITIETDDGFELAFKKNMLIVKEDEFLNTQMFSKRTLDAALSEKETKKKRSIKKRPKDRFQPTMEVDLHIHKLVNSTHNMSKHDILTFQLDTAKRQLEFAMRKRIQKVVFIHGVGEGVLKLELEYLFKRYENVKFYDANYQKYGLGATEVYIYQNA